jgi:hypothetical protein
MAAQASITVVKDFLYRGSLEEWSNTYHFTNDAPTTQGRWQTFADAVIAAEKAAHISAVRIIRVTGHKAGVKPRDFFHDYLALGTQVAGTLAIAAANDPNPGDVAAWVRWATDQFTTKGKPIFLRSYMHCVCSGNTQATCDTLQTTQKTAFETYATAWNTGFSDGTTTHARSGPNGAVGLTPVLASQFVTTRTLERRGRRRPL